MTIENKDIPSTLKFIMTFIDRVGFPILAFLIMSYLCFVSIEKLTVVVQDVKIALIDLKASSK